MTGATDHVVVHRCTVRVVRHGGWSWGADPSGLVDRIMRLLPSIIAEHLDGVDPEAAHLGLDQPVRIVVPLRAGELLAAGPAHAAASVVQEAARALPAMPSPATAVPAPATATPSPSSPPGDPEPPFAEPPTRAALLRFLVGAANRGELAELVALLPLATLDAWHRVLLPLLPAPDATGSSAGERREEGQPWSGAPAAPPTATPVVWGRTSHGARPAPPAASTGSPWEAQLAALARAAAAARDAAPDRDQRLRAELTALTSVAASVGADAALRILARQAADGQPPEPGSQAPTQRQVPAAPHAAPDPGPGRPKRSADLAGDLPHAVEVASVLPFLLLTPLASIGYLQTIAPALQAAGLEEESAAFATALAYTVLGPLERGWRRRPADLTGAAAFAGLSAPEQDLAAFARRVPAALPALDALLAGSLVQGHTAGQPLLLASGRESLGGGLVLADREGLFPIAWVDDVERLLPAWRGCGSPLVLVGPDAATAQVLRGLQAAGVRFVASVPPTRDERWRRLRLPQALWTNDQESSPAVLARQAAGFRPASERLDGVVDALAGARDPVPLATGPALRRSLTLAAGVALATIAWTLWRDREAADPLLALERFGDLSGWVRFDFDRVRVRLPLGRRHADLLHHGFLADVHGVPWLAGRVLEMSGG